MKEMPETAGSIPGSRRAPREGNGNLLQCSYLEISRDRGAWQAVVHGDAELDTAEEAHTRACMLFLMS